MPIDIKEFRKFRKKLGWSGRKLANEAGLSHGTISNIEAGKVVPSDDTVKKCADALGVNIDEIMEENQSKIAINQSNNPMSIIEKDILAIFREISEIKNRLNSLEKKPMTRIKAKKGEI